MAKSLKVWYNAEGDFLKVTFDEKPGYMRETDNDAIMERVDAEDNVIGFSILGVGQLSKDHPLTAQLV